MVEIAVKLVPNLEEKPGLMKRCSNLENLTVGDLIEINGRQERVYKINTTKTQNFDIITLYRHDKEVIANHGYFASIDMLRKGELGQNMWLSVCKKGGNVKIVGRTERKREINLYREYNRFLESCEDKGKLSKFLILIKRYIKAA